MTDDDWKGEHLIRVPRAEKAPDGLCKECGSSLSKTNITGYCLAHRHLAGTMNANGRGGNYSVKKKAKEKAIRRGANKRKTG